jgi:hypothetical protein
VLVGSGGHPSINVSEKMFENLRNSDETMKGLYGEEEYELYGSTNDDDSDEMPNESKTEVVNKQKKRSAVIQPHQVPQTRLRLI